MNMLIINVPGLAIFFVVKGIKQAVESLKKYFNQSECFIASVQQFLSELPLSNVNRYRMFIS